MDAETIAALALDELAVREFVQENAGLFQRDDELAPSDSAVPGRYC